MPASEAAKSHFIPFGGVNPVLRVKDVDASVQYYVQKLGFQKNWGTGGFACVSRGKCSLFLCEGDQGHFGAWVWIGVDDVQVVLEECKRTGAIVRHEPTNYPWALEMQVEDLDGNVLRVGSEPLKDQPTGEWLDMNGVRWLPGGEGKWKKSE